MRMITRLATAAAVLCAAMVGPASAGTLEKVKERGVLNCGVYPNFPGFSSLNSEGKYVGLDIDFCNAVAAAADVDVKHSPLSGSERFPAIQAGTVDMLSMVTTWTASRDSDLGLQFTVPTFYDGQGFIVRKSAGIKSAKELSGATICVLQGTTTELNLADWFRTNKLELKAVTFKADSELLQAYEAERCDAFTGGVAIIAGRRTNFPNPEDHVILPEIISKEPLTPVTLEGDDKWTDIVRWTIYLTFFAEEKGITAANVDEIVASSTDPEIQRFFGKSGNIFESFGFDSDWATRVIKSVGNYSDIYERHLGANTPLGLERGLNAQWTDGGLLYAPPFR